MVTNNEKEQGVKAIIALQALAGIEEPRERAEREWDRFSDGEKENTMAAASRFGIK